MTGDHKMEQVSQFFYRRLRGPPGHPSARTADDWLVFGSEFLLEQQEASCNARNFPIPVSCPGEGGVRVDREGVYPTERKTPWFDLHTPDPSVSVVILLGRRSLRKKDVRITYIGKVPANSSADL
jgi:hypothetical protein